MKPEVLNLRAIKSDCTSKTLKFNMGFEPVIEHVWKVRENYYPGGYSVIHLRTSQILFTVAFPVVKVNLCFCLNVRRIFALRVNYKNSHMTMLRVKPFSY